PDWSRPRTSSEASSSDSSPAANPTPTRSPSPPVPPSTRARTPSSCACPGPRRASTGRSIRMRPSRQPTISSHAAPASPWPPAPEQRGILIGFLPGGYSDPAAFTQAARAAFHSGVDALEVSLPGPAPSIDGPLIQEAAEQASVHFGDYRDGLALAARARAHPD